MTKNKNDQFYFPIIQSLKVYLELTALQNLQAKQTNNDY